MPENQSQPRSDGHLSPSGGPEIAAAAREPRSFGADDIEGIRTDPDDQARDAADYGGDPSDAGDRLPPGVSRAPG